jgi:uroporphyrinogen-III synthase
MDTSWTVHSVNRRPLSASDLPGEKDRVVDTAEITHLNKIAGSLSAGTPLADAMKEVLEFVATVVKYDSCSIYAIDNKELVLSASKYSQPELNGHSKAKLPQSVADWIAESKEPLAVFQEAHIDPRFKAFNELSDDRFEAFLSVPLLSAGHLVGVINVQNRAPHAYSKREVAWIAAAGSLLGAEIERARLETENLHLSNQLETRKVVERAKGILQRDLKISEEDAYLTLQRESRQRRKSMREIASAIILSEELKRAK